MDPRQNIQEPKHHHEPGNVLPPTEIVENPNPRANENVASQSTSSGDKNKQDQGVGSEITDGEDA